MNLNSNPAAVDVNHGLDFERARARLNQDAGRAFRKYMGLKNDPDANPAAIENAKRAYIEANEEYRNLRPGNDKAIEAILGGAR